jgi:hybrid cluster-associated redox disulfide protein
MLNVTIEKTTIIGDVLDFDETTAQYFLEIGMHCLGCPASRGETIEEACAVHGTDAYELIKKLNEHISAK